MVRLAHLSDIHLTAAPLGWRREDWFNKRLAAWFNLRVLGRGFRFRHANQVMAQLVQELRDRQIDHVIFSGDATALGFAAEMEKAAQVLEVGRWSGLAVPGNHDYCTRPAALSGSFEKHFAPWQQGERLPGHVYPFAQRVGHVWLIALNSATGNRWMWDAGGAVGSAQLDRLQQLAARLDPGPRILVTHYPVCLASGECERRTHGLRDMNEVVKAAAAADVGLWLHGHRHHAYWFQESSLAGFPIICAGSATQSNLWSYGEYVIDGLQLQATRRQFDSAAQQFRDAERFTVTISQKET